MSAQQHITMKTTLLDTIKEQNNTTNANTANGAVTNKSSLSECVDYFGLAGGLRSDPNKAVSLFSNAYAEDPDAAMKILFYLRDIRQGQGERRHFRKVWDWIMKPHLNISSSQLSDTRITAFQIPEFGRWDDLLRLVIHPALSPYIEECVRNVLDRDLFNSEYNETITYEEGITLPIGYGDNEGDKPSPGDVTLLAKWMPSLTASNKDAKQSAKDWCDRLNITQKQYRKMLKHLRSHLDVVEQKMCSKDWSKIDYNRVPSQAMLRLRKAFSKNDEKRYESYLDSLERGEMDVKAGTLYPYQLVEKVLGYCPLSAKETQLINAQWRALPEYTDKKQNILTVCDVSGSMTSTFGGVRPLDVAVSLTMYLASRCTNPLWANKFITFSGDPELVSINPNETMSKQANGIIGTNWGMNTNIQRTFDVILHAADINGTTEMPDTIMIISDMEFDHCSGKTNFQEIDEKFAMRKLKRPNLVFWNVNASGSDNNVPVTVNDQGVALVSGFSPSIMQMCFSGDLSPESCLREIVLDNPRYVRISVQA